MNLTNNSTLIPNDLFVHAKYLEPREFLILSVLFYHPRSSGDYLEEATGLTSNEVKKYTDALIKLRLIKIDDNEFVVNARDIDVANLKKRGAPKAKQQKMVFEGLIETQGGKIEVKSWKDFMYNTRITPDERRVIYEFFKANNMDVNNPYDSILDIHDWKRSAGMVKKVIGESWWLIEESVKKLRSAGLTVSTPRSIINTALSLKAKGMGAPQVDEEESKEVNIW